MEESKMNQLKIISGSLLKTIALLTMLLDHTTAVLLKHYQFFITPLFNLLGTEITPYYLLRGIGRIAFPVYCFLLTEGYTHTRCKEKYATRLLCFAVISEIPWNLEHSGSVFYSGQNVFFTLFLGLCAIYIYDQFKKDRTKQIFSLIAVFCIALVLKADYGVMGVGFVLFLYIMRDNKLLQSLIGCCFFSTPAFVAPAFVLINMYNGKRGYIKGRILQYAFYIIYPLHMIILYLLKLYLIGY